MKERELQLRLARREGGGISVMPWISDPDEPSGSLDAMELYRAKDERMLASYLTELIREGYEVTVMRSSDLDSELQAAIAEGMRATHH